MAAETDYYKQYMKEATGEPVLIIRGVLLFFKSSFTNEEMSALEHDLTYQNPHTLVNTQETLLNHNVTDEISRQILALLNKKFKEAVEKKEMTTKKLEFIRSIKKKH